MGSGAGWKALMLDKTASRFLHYWQELINKKECGERREAEKDYIYRNVKHAPESQQLFLLQAGPSEGLSIGL